MPRSKPELFDLAAEVRELAVAQTEHIVRNRASYADRGHVAIDRAIKLFELSEHVCRAARGGRSE